MSKEFSLIISINSFSLITKPLLMFQQPTLISWLFFPFSCLISLFGFVVLFGPIGSGLSTGTVAVYPVGVRRGSVVDELGDGGTSAAVLPLPLVFPLSPPVFVLAVDCPPCCLVLFGDGLHWVLGSGVSFFSCSSWSASFLANDFRYSVSGDGTLGWLACLPFSSSGLGRCSGFG